MYPDELTKYGDSANNDNIIFVDTPGLNDAELGDDEIIQRIKFCHQNERKQGRENITGFIILLRADPNMSRFTGETKTTVQEIAKAFGIEFLKRVVYVFVRAPFSKIGLTETIKMDNKNLATKSLNFIEIHSIFDFFTII